MTPEEWQRVRPILESALELEPARRPAFLDGACADTSLRGEVESLLLSHDQANTNALDPCSEFHPDLEGKTGFELLPGMRIGVYEVVGQIALGGMGAVYRAVRADGQYQQQVALKIVRPDLGTHLTATRFRNERQILASLAHPNIARILDGGTTADGLPYFVMELIDGLPITEYCDKHRLTIDARLEMFRAVCSAVQYAHQRLVIHRDIKPANILITGDGVPKLLDFGIAKILDVSLSPKNAPVTVGGLWLMTPEYASPEQLRGEAVTTGTDVYSLGLVLYELLTGRRTHRFTSRMPHEIARAIFEIDPEKPSTAIRRAADEERSEDSEKSKLTPEMISSLRGGSPEKIRRRLAGDLDNIVLKAIRKEARERYNSADQLSDDLKRHLEGLPVLARKSTIGYRCRKIVMRHKAGVAAAALVSLSLISGIVITISEARIARAQQFRAEQRFRDVRTLANSLMFEVHDSIKDLPGATPARKLLVQRALEYLDSLAREATNDPSLQRDLAVAYERVGDVQGHPYVANLGDTAGALASYRRALLIRASLPKSSGNTDQDQLALSNDYERVGLCLQGSGNYLGALENFQKAIAIHKRLAAANPTPETQERLAGSYFTIAQNQADLGNFEAALGNYRESATLREGITADSPALHARIQMRLAGVYGYMSGILYHNGAVDQAIAMQNNAGAILKNLSSSDPTNAAYLQYLNESAYWAGFYLQQKGQFAASATKYRQARAGFEALSQADPKEERARRFVALCDVSIGSVLTARGRTAEALSSIRKGLRTFEELSHANSGGITDNLANLADAYKAMGEAYSRAAAQSGDSSDVSIADWEEARSAYQKSLGIWRELKIRGAISGFNVGEPGRVARELAKCDVALARLAAPHY